jgi:oligopeptide/dipeptide ABC transporter ATP-binding protein
LLNEKAKLQEAPRRSGEDVLLEVDGLSVEYAEGTRPVRAVDDVSIVLHRGEILGIAGESGSGKSTLARAVTRLLKSPAAAVAGEVLYTKTDGDKLNVLALDDREIKDFRWEEVAIVFQSAMNALNPILRLGPQIDDVLRAHRPGMKRWARVARVAELLSLVGISPDRSSAYPHELSGGMRQRAMIAMGLALDPDIIVMDEPTTALDVVTQRQIIQMILDLKASRNFSVIFITHDLSLLMEICDTIAVMYAGRIVEVSTASDFYQHPRHPYSQALLGSFPTLSGDIKDLVEVPGSPPDMRRLPVGCAFQERCPSATGRCADRVPALRRALSSDDSRSQVACVLYEAEAPDPRSAAEGRQYA